MVLNSHSGVMYAIHLTYTAYACVAICLANTTPLQVEAAHWDPCHSPTTGQEEGGQIPNRPNGFGYRQDGGRVGGEEASFFRFLSDAFPT